MNDSHANPTLIYYRDAIGARHEISVHRTDDGKFAVIDTTRQHSEVIDTLAGYGDGPTQAHAVALDYAAQQHQPNPER